MRRPHSGLLGLVVFQAVATLAPDRVAAQTPELRGRVVEVHDARAKIALDSAEAPAAGSPAELYEVVDDLGEVPVAGSWSVAGIGDGFVWIEADGDAMTPQPGQFAKIRPTGLVNWRRSTQTVEPVSADGPWPSGATELVMNRMRGDPMVMFEWDDGCIAERRDGAMFLRNGRVRGACHSQLVRFPKLRDGRGYAATVALIAGAKKEAFGLTLGADDGVYYTFQIDGQGYYAVMMNDDGWSEIVPWTWRAEIRPGLDAPNRLAVMIEGQQIRLYVNGEMLDVGELPRPVTGFGGVYVDEPGQIVRFDDLQMVELGGGRGSP